jgi:hypothetical protein
MAGSVLSRRLRRRRYGALLMMLAMFGFWGATLFAATPSFDRLKARVAARFAGAPQCDDVVPTIVGTAGDDVLEGTEGPDVIAGLAGNDQINGRGGNDRLCGNEGDDLLNGGAGSDWLLGSSGDDTLRGEDGDDILGGGGDGDELYGGEGDDELRGGAGLDALNGGGHTWRDSCYGGEIDVERTVDCETVADAR